MPHKYKLLSGFEFSVPPAPIDERAEPLLALVQAAGREEAKTPDDTERSLRLTVKTILAVCCPDVLPKVTLADVPALVERMGNLLNDAWGRPDDPGGPDSKKPSAPGVS